MFALGLVFLSLAVLVTVDGFNDVHVMLKKGTMAEIPASKDDSLVEEITALISGIYSTMNKKYWKEKIGLGCFD